MTLEQLRYVVEVYNTKSINKAAQNLFVSQSAISQSIQQLEGILGQDIFVRTNRGVELTAFGRVFIKHAFPIQTQLRQLESVFMSNNQFKYQMTLSIASDGFRLASDMCAYLIQKYFDIGIRIEHYDSYEDDAKTLVANRVAEVGIVCFWSCYKKYKLDQFEALGLDYQPLHEAKVAITIGTGNPLHKKHLTEISPDLLTNSALITHNSIDMGPYKDILSKLNLPFPKSTVITPSRAAIYDLLEFSNSYYINSLWQELEIFPERYALSNGNMYSIPLKGTNIVSERGWVKRHDSPISPIANEFIQCMKEHPIRLLGLLTDNT